MLLESGILLGIAVAMPAVLVHSGDDHGDHDDHDGDDDDDDDDDGWMRLRTVLHLLSLPPLHA